MKNALFFNYRFNRMWNNLFTSMKYWWILAKLYFNYLKRCFEFFFLIPTHLSSYIKYIYPKTCHQIRCSKIEIFLRWIFVYTLTQAFFQSTALLVISSYLQRRQKIMRKTSVSNSLFLGYLRSTFSLFVGLFEWTPSWGRKVVIPLKGFSLLDF